MANIACMRVTCPRLIVTVALSALLAVPASPAHAAQAAAAPGGFLAGFATPVVVIAEDEGITFTNADIAPHNFVALDAFLKKKQARKSPWCKTFNAGECPLFWSPQIGAGDSTEVLGLERTKSGTQYGFVCTVHPGTMRGTLIVR